MSRFKIGDKVTNKFNGGIYEIQATPEVVLLKTQGGEYLPGYIFSGIDRNSDKAQIYAIEQWDFENNFVEISWFLKVHLSRWTFFWKDF